MVRGVGVDVERGGKVVRDFIRSELVVSELVQDQR